MSTSIQRTRKQEREQKSSDAKLVRERRRIAEKTRIVRYQRKPLTKKVNSENNH